MPRSFSRRSAWPRRAGRLSQSARVLLGPSALALMQAGPLAASAWADDSHARRAADHAPHAAPDAAPGPKIAPAVARTAPVAAAAPVKGEDIVVATHRLSPADQARAQLDSLPGAATVIDAKQVLRGRNLTNADALAFQPGVFAQSSGGGDGLRLSIRGSGIQVGTNYFRSGLLMMFDGLPVTTPAGTPYELFEPLGLRYTEVLRGANAFDYGGLQLGGGINYVTQTGYDAQTYQARVEAGSFGYNKEQLSSGKVIGKADYYISLTNSYRGGYQTETQANSFGVNANFGYHFNDRISTRFFFRYRQTENGYPGYLTRDQILENPQQAQAPYRAWHSVRIQPGSKFYGNMTTFQIDDQSKLELGFDYQDAPIDIQNVKFSQIWGYKTVAATLNYTRHDVLAGHKSDMQFGFMDTSDLEAWQTNRVRVQTANLVGLPIGQILRHVTYGGTENYFHLRNNTELFHNFWLTTAAAVAFIQKSSGVPYPYTAAGANFKQSSVNFVPRGGFRYVISPHVELYGNVSRSIQPPNDWNLNYAGPYFTGNTPQSGMNSGAAKLRNQTATTYEIGTTGHAWRNKWSLTYYHSDVRNELLSVMTPASQAIGASIYGNASPTTHQGVEASLETTLYEWAGNTLSLRQAYTWQDFRFRHDAVFGSNRLPGIPEHFYQGEIHLDTKAGFYAGFNAQVSSKVGAAYDETYFAPSYHIYNLNIGYDWPGKHRQIFLSVNNLANTHYAAIVVPGYIAAGKQLAVMQPGDGLGVFAGLSLGFN